MNWDEYEEAKRCRDLLSDDDPFHVKAFDQKLKNMDKTWNEAYLERKGLNPDGTRKEEPVSEVEKQDYYYRNGIHVKDVIDQIYQFFGDDLSSWEATCIYNIMKYLMRYKYKSNPVNDLDKLIVNANWLKKEIVEDL